MSRFFIKPILLNLKFKNLFKTYKHNKCKCVRSFYFHTSNYHRPNNVQHLDLLPRNFHTNRKLSLPVIRDTENEYAYSILQTIPVTNKDTFEIKSDCKVFTLSDFESFLNQDWRSKTAADIVKGFASVQNYCIENNINVSDCRFDKIVDGLMDHVQDLTDSELSTLLKCFISYPSCSSYKDHNFHDVWSALDDVCCWKLVHWSTDTMFQFADYWYRMNLGKQSDYLYHFIDRLQRKMNSFSKNELIHLFFYLKIHKRQKMSFEYHSVFNKYVKDMTIQEIAVVSITYVVAQINIKLVDTAATIIDKLKQSCSTADEISVRKTVEVLRYSSHVMLVDRLMDLLDHLEPEINRLSNLCCIHIALLGTTLQFYHENSLRKVSQKIANSLTDLNSVRLKDMERLLLALTMFNFDPQTSPDIFRSIYEEIHKQERLLEIVNYPRVLPSILNFLAFKNMYSYELMDRILLNSDVLELYGKSPKTLPRDIFSLDVSIDIECPDYKGNRLNKLFRHKAAKWLVEYTPTWDQYKKLTSTDKFVLDVIDTITKLFGGHQNFRTDHILPNYVKSDIILCKDNTGNFIKPLGFDKYILGDVMHVPDSSLTWYAIIPVNWNNTIRNTSIPLGLIRTKERQLKNIGYKPILIIWNEFQPLNNQDKLEHVRRKLEI